MSLRTKIILLSVSLLVIGIALVYYFAWRPSDSSYNDADAPIKAMVKATKLINPVFALTHYPTDISDKYVSYLEAASKSYNSALDSYLATPAASRDIKLGIMYSQNKSIIVNYGQSVSNIQASMQAYRTLTNTCGNFVSNLSSISTAAGFDAAASKCKDSISNASSAPDSAFKDQYLSKYIPLATNLLTAFRQQIGAGSDKTAQNEASDQITSIRQKISSLDTTKLSLTVTDSTDTLQKLDNTILSQQKVFLR